MRHIRIGALTGRTGRTGVTGRTGRTGQTGQTGRVRANLKCFLPAHYKDPHVLVVQTQFELRIDPFSLLNHEQRSAQIFRCAAESVSTGAYI